MKIEIIIRVVSDVPTYKNTTPQTSKPKSYNECIKDECMCWPADMNSLPCSFLSVSEQGMIISEGQCGMSPEF